MSNLPLFIVPGMPRCGTTFLYVTLQEHPDVCLSYRKELNYFNNASKLTDESYAKQFDCRANQICGDISPAYFLDLNSIDRIKKFSPDAKIIMGVRSPIDYVVSYYNQLHKFIINPPKFKDFVDGKFTYKIGTREFTPSFFNDSIYDAIAAFCSEFGDKLLIFTYEQLDNDPLVLMKKVEKFLGINPYFNSDNLINIKINASDRKENRVIGAIAANEMVIKLASFIPAPFIAKLRKMVSVTNANNREEGNKVLISEEDMEYAKAGLVSQSDKIADLITEPFMLGNGNPYDS